MSPPISAISVGHMDAGVPQEVYLGAALSLHVPRRLPISDWKKQCPLLPELVPLINSF